MILLSLVDFFICRLLLGFGFKYDTKEFNLQRFKVPYIEFTGKPFALDHNEMGYRGKPIKEASDSAVKILFFGGSTGYYGNPTIAQYLEKNLKESLHKDVFVANCSVVSSNHNQHVHALVEQFMNYKVDMVVFYGGYNENIQPLYYDPRPGFPFNFYYRNECPIWRLNLIKYSAICGELEKRFRLISGIKNLKKCYEKDNTKWFNAIEDNYFSTLDEARKITTKVIGNSKERPCLFVAFYQPYKVPEIYIPRHYDIKRKILKSDCVFDASYCLDSISKIKNVYFDDVHVSSEANSVIANSIVTKIVDLYNRGER